MRDGYIIRPAAPDAKIQSVWLSRKNHLVLEYGYQSESGYRVDFFDTANETRLSTDKEGAMGHDNQACKKKQKAWTFIKSPASNLHAMADQSGHSYAGR